MSDYSFHRLFTEIIDLGNDRFVKWLIDKNLLPSNKKCECEHDMKLISHKIGNWGYFICDYMDEHADAEPRIISMFKGTVFEKTQLDPLSFVILLLCYAKNFTIRQAMQEISYKYNHLSTVKRFYIFCNEAISEAMFYIQQGNLCIGGDGKIIEVFQTKFGARRSLRGMVKENMCVLCMIEKDSKNFIIEKYEEKNQEISFLFGLLRRYVIPGTIILAERFKEYTTVDELNLYNFSGDYSSFPGCHIYEVQKLMSDSNQSRLYTGDMVMRTIFKLQYKSAGIHTFELLLNIMRLIGNRDESPD